jgi:hypothetical protein
VEWTDADLAYYDRLCGEREKRRTETRRIPSVIRWFGELIEIDGWHDSAPRFRITDDLEPTFAPSIAVTGNRPNLRRNRNFGKAQKRVAPTNRKAR